jgi:hypothetical protein
MVTLGFASPTTTQKSTVRTLSLSTQQLEFGARLKESEDLLKDQPFSIV